MSEGAKTIALVERNIGALLARRQAEERALGWQDRLAERITAFTGSMPFAWLHALLFSAWVLVNPGLLHWAAGLRPDIRHAGHDRLGRGDLPLDLHPDHAEPHAGAGRRSCTSPRSSTSRARPNPRLPARTCTRSGSASTGTFTEGRSARPRQA
jgi:hypothetical protein